MNDIEPPRSLSPSSRPARQPRSRLSCDPRGGDLARQPEERAHPPRLYGQDVAHFMRTLGITTPEQLRQVDHRAVMAWERIMREQEGAAASTVRRRLAALSSLFKHLVWHGSATRNPVVDVQRPAINREEGTTAAFSKAQARRLLDAPPADTVVGLRDRAILSVGLQFGLRRAEIAALTVGDLQQNRGLDALRLTRKGGRAGCPCHQPANGGAHPGLSGASRPWWRPWPTAVPTATWKCQGARSVQPNGPGCGRPRSPEICRRHRPAARLLGAFDASDVYNHGAGKWGAAGGCAEGCRTSRPIDNETL